MTKKRFIKLLMSQGTQRNEAQIIAMFYNAHNTPYEIAYKYICSRKRIISAIEPITENIKNGFKAMRKALCILTCSIVEMKQRYFGNDEKIYK